MTTESQELPTKEREKNKTYPNLRFQPGDHGENGITSSIMLPSDAMDRFNRFLQGDQNAHAWNQGLVTRVEATQPKIIAIDGLGFGEESNDTDPQFIPASSAETWIALPTTPEKINQTDKSVLVVNGDETYLGEPFNVLLMNHPDMQALRTALNNRVTKDYVNSLNDDSQELYAMLATVGLIEVALGGNIRWDRFKKKEKLVSRRTFAKGAAAVGLAVLAGSYFRGRTQAPLEAAASKTEGEKNKWLDIVTLTEPKIIKSKYENMRTALLILKTKDAIDTLNLPPDVSSSVIMGPGHSYGAEDFLTSDVQAQEAIKEYLDIINPVLTEALQRNPKISRKQAVEKIKALLSQTFVQQVSQPDSATYGTPNFPKAVEDATRNVADFKSPRVEAALAGFH